MHVFATAGHVDHGKSSLILALTGTDPDRFKEEKERGLTIDLGFAHISLPSGEDISLIDVPGHIKFIKNMLAGVGAIDGAIFVVAATEGWKPQSEEHLRILDLLGVSMGLIVLTKSDLVDEDWLELTRLEITERVEGSFLTNAPIIAIDSLSGNGLDDLVGELEKLCSSTPTSPDNNRPRLWIDRVFSAKGSGTIVTGTLSGGTLKIDQEVAIVGSSGKTWNVQVSNLDKQFLSKLDDISSVGRIRGLQSHGSKVDIADPGRRLAVNLANISPETIKRGDVLVNLDQWCATSTFDAKLKVLSNLNHPVTKKGAFATYIGSADFPATISIFGKNELSPGEEGYIRIHINSMVPLTKGDRFILRELGRQETIAGGEVINVNPRSLLSSTKIPESALDILDDLGVCNASLLYKMTGESIPVNLGDSLVISDTKRNALTTLLIEKAREAGEIGFEVGELDDVSKLLVKKINELEVDGSRVRQSGLSALKDSLAEHPFIARLEDSLYNPPEPTGVDRIQLRELIRRNLIIECEGIYFSPLALTRAKSVIWELCKSNSQGFTLSQLRECLETTRKYLLPLIGYLDSQGITRRNGDFRTPGPVLIREFTSNQ